MFRINPYLQQPSSDGIYITWFTENNISSQVSITGPGLNSPLTFTTNPTFEPILTYTNAELNQEIAGLEPGSWLLGDENYKHTVDLSNLLPDSTYQYAVTVGDDTFESSFETAPTAEDWDEIRFVVLSDSETEPRGRVNRRDWQQGALEAESSPRPDTQNSLWAENIGVSGDRLNYPLTENVGYRNNLEIINSREPDFLMMPGDLIQGGGYQPAWDEFFRHNAGEFDSGLSEYAILPALGNWENFGALNGGYGTDADGRYGPLFGREKYHVYFDAPANGTPEHQDNYYRTDYGPITILTLDSSNGEPDDNRSNYGGEGQPPQISGREYTGPGTDTQQNITREQYEAAGGTDLADFNPGSPQWNWVQEQLQSAQEQGQIVFAQFHHAPYSNGTHGLPMNHEDSSGQGGTPMRQYQPLFEEYGVVAVFSGHSEMFERSFVDEDNDGEGVYYYDVGVAGDGMRGQRTDEEGNLLSYNQFSQWTADQNEPELWQEVDGVLQNVAGGKHYGHLEVNLENLDQEDKTRITFTPVYSFPVLDANYNLIDTERRVYGDEIVIELDNTNTPELSPLGTPGDDDIFPIPDSGFDGRQDILFTGAGRDSVDLVLGAGNVEDNRVFLGSDNDTIYVNRRDRVFGSTGNDTFDATDAEGGNRMSGGAGDDIFYLGKNDRVLGGDGDDQFFVQVGGDNLIAGGAGNDQFWIANVELPQTANTIVDFQVGTDVIGVSGAVGLGITTSTLELSQVGGDTHVSFDNQTLAVLTGIQAVSLDVSDASQFVLV